MTDCHPHIQISNDNIVTLDGPVPAADLVDALLDHLNPAARHPMPLTSPSDTAGYLKLKIGLAPQERFWVLFLDTRHRVLAVEELFRGTIDGASVYPREVARACLAHNAAAVIFAHNHPSGVAEPSQADRLITERLVRALGLLDIRVLDHLVVSASESVSLAERGWL